MSYLQKPCQRGRLAGEKGKEGEGMQIAISTLRAMVLWVGAFGTIFIIGMVIMIAMDEFMNERVMKQFAVFDAVLCTLLQLAAYIAQKVI